MPTGTDGNKTPPGKDKKESSESDSKAESDKQKKK